VFDDQLSVVENFSIRDWRQPGALFVPERELPVAGRPLVNLSFAWNYAVGGLDVFGYHPVNLVSLMKRVQPAAARVALVVVAAALAAGTVTRNQDYESALRLATTTVERRPTAVAHHVLATELLKAGRSGEAMVHLGQAVEGAPRGRFTLGVQLLDQGHTTGAIAELQRFLREQPLLLEAVSARQLLRQALAQQQHWPQAIEQY
jgi:hypothetical protein